MAERKQAVTVKNKPITLIGNTVEIGKPAPDFVVIDNDMKPVKLSDFAGKICIICSVPSLDTSVCDIETRKFNKKATQLSGDIVILTISMDLPFAQKRWCAAAGVKNVKTLSDHKDASFGNSYGVLIKELRLLARAVFIVDKDGILRYRQLVSEVSTEPDYDNVFNALQEITT